MSEATKPCTYCKEKILVEAIKCKHCGAYLGDSGILTEQMDAQIRRRLPPEYELFEEIGRGGLGVVYRARQRSLDRLVAVKVLMPEFTTTPALLECFHNEARRAAKLNLDRHPNIITIFDQGEKNGVHYIAMELVEGDDLWKIILNRGPLAVEQLLTWLKPVAVALGFIHSQGMVHRNLKPANILIGREGQVKLTDFGFARINESAKFNHPARTLWHAREEISGPVQFMSPEQIEQKRVDHRTDIYSFGVVMYQGLTGGLPFKADSDFATRKKIVADPPTYPSQRRESIPHKAEKVILRCMEKEPERRYPNGDELIADLDRVLDPKVVDISYEPISVTIPILSKNGSTSVSSRDQWLRLWQPKILKAAAVLAVVIIVVIAAIRIISSRDNPPVPPDEPKTGIVKLNQKQIDSLLAPADDFIKRNRWREAWSLLSLLSDSLTSGRKEKIFAEMLKEAENLNRRGNFKEALAKCDSIIALDAQRDVTPTRAKIHEKWGDAFLAQNNFNTALEKYREGLKDDADSKTLKGKEQTALWVGIDLVEIKKGQSFAMGTTGEDSDERPVHQVQLSRFRISRHEITLNQYAASRHPNAKGTGEALPASNVSWNDAKAFCQWLWDRTKAKEVRLPYEAEWEYAARAQGQNLKWAGTNNENDLRSYANYKRNSGERIAPVGQDRRANGIGLFDMSGNVSEWCEDWYGRNYYFDCLGEGLITDPPGPRNGKERVVRGGSARNSADDLRNTRREKKRPDQRDPFVGFRIVVID